MRSRERGFGWAAVALVLTGFWFAALGAWALVARSTIPAGLDGTVTAIELRHEKHPGVDDVWMVSVDAGKPRHVDRQVADLLEQGDHVRKEPWDSVLVVDGHPHTLSLSEDARTMLVFAPVVGLVSAALTLVSALRARAVRKVFDRTARSSSSP